MIIEFIFPTSTIYVTEEFSDRVYIEDVIVNVSGDGGGGGGVTDHGLLTGLGDDDHTQYLNQARGDARYYTETEVDTLLSGKANTSHTHIISDVTGLQTALDGKAATSHTHVIADVTGLQTALDGKQETLVSGTNIKTVNSESLLGSGNITAGAAWGGVTGTITSQADLMAQLYERENYTNFLQIENALGSTVKAYGILGPRFGMVGSFSSSLTDGRVEYTAIWIPSAMTLTGVEFFQGIQGNFTADNENAIALFTYSGGTMTKVATSANNGDIWKGASNTMQRVAFTTPYAATRGLYYIGLLYNSSAQITAPAINVLTTSLNAAIASQGYSDSAKIFGFRNSQSALPSTTEAMTNVTAFNRCFYLAVY